MDINYPPYAQVGKVPDTDLAGFNPDFVKGMMENSDIKVKMM